MSGVIRIRYRGWRSAAVAIVAFLAAGNAFAQQRAEGLRETARPAPAQTLEILGPGPLLPRPMAGKRIDQPKAATVEEGIDQCVENNMARLNAPGAAVAVVLDGELIYESGYGVKVRGGTAAVNPETIFRIGSVT